MITHYFKLFGFIALFFVLVAVVLLALILGFKLNDRSAGVLLSVIFGTLIVVIVLFVPYLDWSMKKVFYFPSESQESINFAELKKKITQLNDLDVPVTIAEKNAEHLKITWRYTDAEWYGLLVKKGLKNVYELHLKFDPEKKKVTAIDVKKNVNWGASPGGIKISGGFVRGVYVGIERGAAWGLNENFKPGKAYDYRFDPSEIKNPVINTILRAGWDVQFGIW